MDELEPVMIKFCRSSKLQHDYQLYLATNDDGIRQRVFQLELHTTFLLNDANIEISEFFYGSISIVWVTATVQNSQCAITRLCYCLNRYNGQEYSFAN